MARDFTTPTTFDTPAITQMRNALKTLDAISLSTGDLTHNAYEIGRVSGMLKLAIIESELVAKYIEIGNYRGRFNEDEVSK